MKRIPLLGFLLTAPLLLATTCAEQLLRPRIEFSDNWLITLSPDGSTAGGIGYWKNGADIELPNAEIFVTGISNGARVIVGSDFTRWEDGVLTALPTGATGRPDGELEDVSADGLVAVGYVYGPGTVDGAAMWVDGVASPITADDGFAAGIAYAVSADGETVLLAGRYPGGPVRRYLWRAGEVTPVPSHPDVVDLGTASVDCLSDDGTTAVFTDRFEPHPVFGVVNRAFRWREGGVLEELGDPEAFPSVQASGVTRNGEVVVGSAYGGSSAVATIWDATHGMRSLAELLLELGAPFPADFHPRYAFDISADGRRIVGSGDFPARYGVSFVVTLPPACADHLDNDGDGLTDWPEDPNCGLRLDLSEAN